MIGSAAALARWIETHDDIAVIVHFPLARPVTRPFSSTVATFWLEDDHVISVCAAFLGLYVAFSVFCSYRLSVSDVRFSFTCVTGLYTVTVHSAMTPLSVLARITAVPAFNPFTTPPDVTDATFGDSDVHFTFFSVAFSGRYSGFSVSVFPRASSALSGIRTSSTGMTTHTVMVAVFLL